MRVEYNPLCNLGALKAGEANLELRRAADGRQLAREKSCQETSRWKPDKEAQRPTTTYYHRTTITTTTTDAIAVLGLARLHTYPRQYVQGRQQNLVVDLFSILYTLKFMPL